MCIFLHTAPSSPDGEDRSVTPPPSASSSSGDVTPSANIGKCTMSVALFSPYNFTFLTCNNFFSQVIEAATKWLLSCRQHFEIHVIQ